MTVQADTVASAGYTNVPFKVLILTRPAGRRQRDNADSGK